MVSGKTWKYNIAILSFWDILDKSNDRCFLMACLNRR
jgi:hypothetical protein